MDQSNCYWAADTRTASTRGFEHLHLIENSLQSLYRAFGSKHLKSFNENFVLGSSADDIFREPIIGTQRIAKRIAGHYRLPVTTVIVTFNSSLQPPGRVELSNSNEFFVELQSQFRSNPKAIGAVLAHEVAHIFLHRCGVRFPEELNNEVLTDTTAVYVGFGPTIMNAATETTSHFSNNVIQTNTHHFGYLSLDEFGYILAKRDSLFDLDSTSMIDSGIASTTFACGRDLNQRQLRARPFVTRPWYQRFFHSLSGYGSPQLKVIKPFIFNCPCCLQGLRIPQTHQKLSVHCPNCDSRFPCYS